MNIKEKLNYFTKIEKILWLSSFCLILFSSMWFGIDNYITLSASLIGTTSLIYIAKGNPFGHLLMVVFSILYAIVSFENRYYGEMITYLGMSAPMSVLSLVTWIKNPYGSKKSEVKIHSIKAKEIPIIFLLSIVVTFIFYYVLKFFGTANILPSTISVTTSFFALALSFRRTPYFALAYATNDIVLIVLWSMASFQNISYISVIVCFVVFLFNDTYSFINWKRMQKSQNTDNK